MKKRNIIIVSLLVLMIGFFNANTSYAQIFIMDEEFNDLREDAEPFPFPGIMPDHDTTWDYSPIGNGIWLLGGLAGAYLLGKRKRKDDE